MAIPSHSPSEKKPINIDPLPPESAANTNSVEAEQGVLACILWEPETCRGVCLDRIKEPSVVFYDIRHQELYTFIMGMMDKKEPVSIQTVCIQLRAEGKLDPVGGLAYVSGLQDAAPSPANLNYYIDILLEFAQRRILADKMASIALRARNTKNEIDKLIEEAQQSALAASQISSRSTKRPMKELVRMCIDRIQDRYTGRVNHGIKTGIHSLDKVIKGFKPDTLITIAARPGEGKSSMMRTLVSNIASDHTTGIGVITLEMSIDEMIDAVASAVSRTNLEKIKEFTPEEMNAFTKAVGSMAKMKIEWDEDSYDLSAIISRVFSMVQDGAKIVFIDQLSNISHAKGGTNRKDVVWAVAYALKRLARKLHIPIVILHQLNRDATGKSKYPTLSRLKDSGAVEEASDIVLLLHPKDELQDMNTVEMDIIVAKHRQGSKGVAQVMFHRYCQLIEDIPLE
jgi:replicative DNA helicase